MRINRQRRRTLDPLAHPDAIRHMLDRLRELLPEKLPRNEKHLLRMLHAVRHLERRQATDTRRGRPSPWRRPDLIRVASCLRGLLDRETSGRVSLNSFLGLYIRVLDFPTDVTEALISGDINLFEAAQLARINAKRIGASTTEAHHRREEILRAHLFVQGSGAQLRSRINELLGFTAEPVANPKDKNDWGFIVVDELLEVDPYDSRHLFWEELRRIAVAIHQVTPEDVDDKILEELLPIIDKLSVLLVRLEKQRSQEPKGKLIV
jgi:hypothetical protein